MKKLINQPDAVLPEFLEGLVSVSPGLRLLPNGRVVVRADLTDEIKDREVALISGGGSEKPAHVGYVGAGMLSAAVAGDVFTSPSTDSVLQAIRAVTGAAGAILIVKNYTGDRLNFGLAAEVARAEGLTVEMVMVGDDVALARMASAGAGRRGIAGTVFVNTKLRGLLQPKERRFRLFSTISKPLLNQLALWELRFRLAPCRQPVNLASRSVRLKLNLAWVFMERRASGARRSNPLTPWLISW